MISKINDIEIKNPETLSERKWFSLIKQRSEELDYGNMDLRITIKNGKVVAIKIITREENFNINA